MNSILLKIFTPFLILGIFLTSPSLGAVAPDAMKKALSEGIEKSTGNNTDPISKEIIQLSSSFDSDVSSGDHYEFIYLPDLGTHVLKNSELVELIKGISFKKAFFGIFLSDNPIQKNLKKALLGG